MKLYYSLASPYARKVRIFLRELGVDSLEEVLVNTADNHPGLIATNPLGKVPALSTPDGEILFDSRVICEFLDETFNKEHWLPQTWGEKVALAAIEGIMDQSVVMIIEKKRPEPQQYDYWLERYRIAIPRSLQWLYDHGGETMLNQFNLTTISLAVALEYLDFRHPEVVWRQTVPELADWLETVSHRSSLQETRPT